MEKEEKMKMTKQEEREKQRKGKDRKYHVGKQIVCCQCDFDNR